MTTKHTIATISLALVAFVFGCVTEALVVPPVRADTNSTRWEYELGLGDTLNRGGRPDQMGDHLASVKLLSSTW
jgi:hypothetical protein